MLAQRLQAKPEPHEDPLLCGRLAASTGGRHFLTISLDTAGLRRRVWESGNFKDNCQLVVCYCVSSDHAYRNSMELFIPIVHAVRHNPAGSRNIWTKWQPSYMARIPQSRSSSCGSNSTYSRCTSMILYQIILLFYCWLTQHHFNFSVSFSFKDGYGFGGFSSTPPSEPNLSTPPPPLRGILPPPNK